MPTMDVQFRNPFYHGSLGLLGGAGEEGTTYILDDQEPIPRTAIVLEGVSQDRKNNEVRGKAASKAAAEDGGDDDEGDQGDVVAAKRVRPKEGKVKGSNIPKKRK